MKVNQMKSELEKVAKVLPDVRRQLDQIYHLEAGKKGRIKLLWKEYEPQVKELKSTKEFRDIFQ